MKLILPVAGYGKRMRPHTWSRPKVLIDVAGKPMLGHVLDQFADVGLDEVIYITGWLVDATGTYAAAFALCAAVNIFGAVVWLFFATAERVID